MAYVTAPGRAAVAPSILSADFARLADSCRRVLDAGAPLLHLDVMDGAFVPNISFGVPVVAALRRALPGVFFDVHLMIARPAAYVAAFAGAGADLISFHLEAEGDPGATIDAIHAAGAMAGIVLKPATPAAAAFPWLARAEMALVMSVEPGFGGQKFMPAALDKLAILRSELARTGRSPFFLEVDGGINAQTAPLAAAAGANLLVAGSAVFGAADPAAALAVLSACPTGADSPALFPFSKK